MRKNSELLALTILDSHVTANLDLVDDETNDPMVTIRHEGKQTT